MLSSAPSTSGSSASISFFPPLWAASTLFTFSMVSSSVILSHVLFKCHTVESKHDSRAVNTPKFSSVVKVTHLDQKKRSQQSDEILLRCNNMHPIPQGGVSILVEKAPLPLRASFFLLRRILGKTHTFILLPLIACQ